MTQKKKAPKRNNLVNRSRGTQRALMREDEQAATRAKLPRPARKSK